MWTWEKKQSIIRQDPASGVREKQVAILAEAGLETRDREIAQHSRLFIRKVKSWGSDPHSGIPSSTWSKVLHFSVCMFQVGIAIVLAS